MKRTAVFTPAADIKPERLRWLWAERLPLRGLSLIAGEPGLGKSTLGLQLAADVTRGRLPGDLHGEPSDVVVATAEDHWGSVVYGRLVAAGADLERVHRLTVQDRAGEVDLPNLPDDVAAVERACDAHAHDGRPISLVIIDPVAAFIGGGVDTHRDASVRRVLAPLAAFAERQQPAVVGIAHLNKDSAGKLLGRVGGSVAFGAAPRSVLAFARHPDDGDGERGVERVIVQAKSNHGRFAPSLAARVESFEVPEVGSVSRLVIVGECEVGPEDLRGQDAGERSDLDAAAEWLADELGDGEWHPSREVKARAMDASHSSRTVERAREKLGAERDRRGFPSVAVWRLPPVPPSSDGGTGGTGVGGTGETRTPKAKTGDSGPQSRQLPAGGGTATNGGPLIHESPPSKSGPTLRPGACICTRPARSPRANGPDQCANCKRAIHPVAEAAR